MHELSQARSGPASVDLREGLAVDEVHLRLEQGLGLQETGQRILAFYLTEMEARRLHQETGHATTLLYAEDRLELDRRRTRELLSVGKKLLALPRIDDAFCEQRIGWSKLLLLVRIAVPEHEVKWLERALELTCRDLAGEVATTTPGDAPRKPGERRGLSEPHFVVSARVGVLAHRKIDLAKQMLAAELDRPVSAAELFEVLAEQFLSTEDDGTIPGRKHVPASLYRIVLRPEGGGGEEGDGKEGDGERILCADSEIGPLPIDGGDRDDALSRVRSDCIRCDGERAQGDDDEDPESGNGSIDQKTPPALRRRVLARDGDQCRCCNSRTQLMVHHIRYRSKGGRTRTWNLITLCMRCHALVHAGLLVLEGKRAQKIRFKNRKGKRLHEPGCCVKRGVLLKLERPEHVAKGNAPVKARPKARPKATTLDTIPAVVDGAWWRRHADLIQCRGKQGLAFRPGVPLPEQDGSPTSTSTQTATPTPTSIPNPTPTDDVFAGFVGQDALLRRLETTAEGSRTRGRGFPHTLFVGPAGTGKTTLAHGVAARFGARLHATNGPVLQDTHALIGLLAGLREGDMLFLDEIHAVPRTVLETLYQAMAEGALSLTLHSGPRARTLRLELHAFTLLAATTEDGELPDALRSRFGLLEHISHYIAKDLAALVTGAARSQGFGLEGSAAERLAESARGTPREALRLLERVLDQAASRGHEGLDGPAVERALRRLGYDRDGLAPAEQQYMAVLRESRDPIPLGRLARLLGSSARTLLRHLEPPLFRRGLVRMTPRGRTAAYPPALLAGTDAMPGIRRTSGGVFSGSVSSGSVFSGRFEAAGRPAH